MRLQSSTWIAGVRRNGARAAFTLIEVLAVLALMAVIAALVAPTLKSVRKSDVMLAASHQLQNGVAYARRLAISEHTTVYMVFVPTNFWGDSRAEFMKDLTIEEQKSAVNLIDKQLRGYGFFSPRTVGDQPGRPAPRYLAPWQSLPEGTFIPQWKFNALNPVGITNAVTRQEYYVERFPTMLFPFPTQSSAYKTPPREEVELPYIAFNYLGQVVSTNGLPMDRDVIIPLAHGSVLVQRSEDRVPVMYDQPPPKGPLVRESPPNNSVLNYNLVRIDRLTGRALPERQEAR